MMRLSLLRPLSRRLRSQLACHAGTALGLKDIVGNTSLRSSSGLILSQSLYYKSCRRPTSESKALAHRRTAEVKLGHTAVLCHTSAFKLWSWTYSFQYYNNTVHQRQQEYKKKQNEDMLFAIKKLQIENKDNMFHAVLIKCRNEDTLCCKPNLSCFRFRPARSSLKVFLLNTDSPQIRFLAQIAFLEYKAWNNLVYRTISICRAFHILQQVPTRKECSIRCQCSKIFACQRCNSPEQLDNYTIPPNKRSSFNTTTFRIFSRPVMVT